MSLSPEFGEIEEFYEDYLDKYIYEETFWDVWDNCVVLSTYSILPTILKLFALNFAFGCLLSTGLINEQFYHLMSGFIGIYLINTIGSSHGKIVLIICFILAFAIFYSSWFIRRRTNISNTNFLKVIFVVSLILCEYYLISQDVWLQIRGIVMVLAMKLISLADDVEKTDSIPNFIQFFGYSLSGTNVMFGPWIPFCDYLDLHRKPIKKNVFWIVKICQVLLTSLFFLALSNCWSGYLIKDSANRWFAAYKEALTFRTSHYFICYLSELGMVSAGFAQHVRGESSPQFRYSVTEPSTIEFPSALAIVVRNWNKPMHDFLKKYVYRSWLDYGKFPAILATFLMSSFLHGLELKVSVVLVTIGIFSYLQVALRDRIATIFDCCIRVRPCKNCNHHYKRSDIAVRLLLICYSLFTVFHLAYLGILMDPSTDEVGILGKWHNLYFASHLIMFFNILIIV